MENFILGKSLSNEHTHINVRLLLTSQPASSFFPHLRWVPTGRAAAFPLSIVAFYSLSSSIYQIVFPARLFLPFSLMAHPHTHPCSSASPYINAAFLGNSKRSAFC